jgi:hypothetical protein
MDETSFLHQNSSAAEGVYDDRAVCDKMVQFVNVLIDNYDNHTSQLKHQGQTRT